MNGSSSGATVACPSGECLVPAVALLDYLVIALAFYFDSVYFQFFLVSVRLGPALRKGGCISLDYAANNTNIKNAILELQKEEMSTRQEITACSALTVLSSTDTDDPPRRMSRSFPVMQPDVLLASNATVFSPFSAVGPSLEF